MTNHIQESSGIIINKEPTKLFEDNAACVAQLKEDYIKNDRTKHIPPRFFSYTRELEKNQEVDIQYIRSTDNAADLFTKTFPTTTFKKHVHSIRMRHLKDLSIVSGGDYYIIVLFFPLSWIFILLGFSMIRILTRQYVIHRR